MSFDLEPYVTRLKDQLVGWSNVGGAADLQAIEGGYIKPPGAFIVPMGDMPSDNPLYGEFVQHVLVKFGVVLVVANLADTSGSSALTDLARRRDEVRAALQAWSPDGSFGDAQRGPGALLQFTDGLLWWMDEYRTDYYERIEP